MTCNDCGFEFILKAVPFNFRLEEPARLKWMRRKNALQMPWVQPKQLWKKALFPVQVFSNTAALWVLTLNTNWGQAVEVLSFRTRTLFRNWGDEGYWNSVGSVIQVLWESLMILVLLSFTWCNMYWANHHLLVLLETILAQWPAIMWNLENSFYAFEHSSDCSLVWWIFANQIVTWKQVVV